MTILEEFDESKEAVVNPTDWIKPVPGMPRVVVSCFAKETFERMVSSFGGERVGETREANMVIPVYKTVCKGIPVGMYMSAVGAPACVSVAEEIFAMGAEVIILFGTCGVLNRRYTIAPLLFLTEPSVMRGPATTMGRPRRKLP